MTTMARGRDTGKRLRAEYRALPLSARMLSTTRPHVLYWMAAVEIGVFVVLGAILMTTSVLGGVLVASIGLIAAIFPVCAARWSEHHADEARNAVGIQRDLRNRLAQRHPAFFIVLLPVIVAVDAAVRFNNGRRHPSMLDWSIPAAAALVLGLIVGIVVVRQARRARRAVR